MNELFATPVGCVPETACLVKNAVTTNTETSDQRITRLYASDGGPLIGWLLDECHRRGHTQRDMADELGVTYSYIYQLRCGVRQTQHISSEVAGACGRYLGVPTIVVKVLAGVIPMSDFVWPFQSEDDLINRALDKMKADPIARALLPADVRSLPMATRRSLVLIYSESSGQDVLGVRKLPDVLHWLQRAALIHDDNATRAMA